MAGWTQADIDKLRASINDSEGAAMIVFSDRTIQFASLKERVDLLAQMEHAVAVATSTARAYRLATYSKGT